MAQRYRHRIVIETPTETQDNYGEITETWETLLTVWASLDNVSAGELFEAGSQVQQNHFVFELYCDSSVTTECRIKYGTRYFDIEGVENVDNRSRKMRIRAIETDAS